MFARIYTENFRNIVDGTMSFKNRKGAVKQSIFLFGENGVGKSSLVHVFSLLKRSCDALLFNSRIAHLSKEWTPFSLQEAAIRNVRLGSKGDLVLIYELVINRDTYFYSLRLSHDGTIRQESLLKRYRNEYMVVFSSSSEGLYIDEKLLNQRNREIIHSYYENYGKEYTVLSIFYFTVRTEKIHVKKNFRDFVHRVGRVHIQDDTITHEEHQNIIEDYGVSSNNGYVSEELIQFYKASAIVISQIIKTIYPRVDHVRYAFKREGSVLTYNLETYVNTHYGIQRAQDYHLPASYNHVLDFCTVFLDAYVGNAVVYDNVGRLFSPETLKYLLGQLMKQTKAQTIFTLNYPTLLNFVDPHSIYIFQKVGDYIKICSLEEVETIRENHNVRKRYESGVYHHFNPVEPNYNHYRLMQWFEKHVQTFIKKSKI